MEIKKTEEVVRTSSEGRKDLPIKKRKQACRRKEFTQSSISSEPSLRSSVGKNSTGNNEEYVSSCGEYLYMVIIFTIEHTLRIFASLKACICKEQKAENVSFKSSMHTKSTKIVSQ